MKKSQLSFEICNLSYQFQLDGGSKDSILSKLRALLKSKAHRLGELISEQLGETRALLGSLALQSWEIVFEKNAIHFEMIHCKSSNSWYIKNFDIK